MIDLAACMEAHITGITVIEEKNRMEIVLRAPGSKRFVLAAEGMDRFLMNEFRERNIVDRVFVWDFEKRAK